MQVGLNYPWSYNRFGADLGPNPFVPVKQWREEAQLADQGKASRVPLPPLFDHLDRNLQNLKNMKIEVVRFFILANGFTLRGTGPTPRHTPSPSPLVPFYDWSFSPTLTADQRFAYQFSVLLQRFRDAGLQIIPSLISYEFGGNSTSRDGKGLAPGGRADCINDPNKRQVFLGTVLNDLLIVSQKYKEQIFAWEVINEPYWNCTGFGPLSTGNTAYPSVGAPPPPKAPLTGFGRWPEVTVDQMNAFLKEAIGLIEGKGLPSTVGHRFYSDIDPRQPLFAAGKKPQFHYYAKTIMIGDPFQIEGLGLFSGNPKPFLGEFDSDLNRFGKPWLELKGKDTTLNRLKLLQKEGCELALLWPDLGAPGDQFRSEQDHMVKDDPIKLVKSTRQGIVDFTGGKMPPDDQ
jgi:hypothetical protein